MSSRPLKFRLWLNKESRYLYQDGYNFMVSEGKAYTPMDYDGGLEELDGVIEQFTGLQDKNGKEIYEGDIIETFTSQVSMFKGRQLFQIKWLLDTANFIIWKDNACWWTITKEYMNNHCSVIGNTHQNKELL